MAVQPTLLLIADIAGYTRFMKMHYMSLVHAQDIVARLLEAIIDAAEPQLKLAKLEGDAAFFYLPFRTERGSTPGMVAEQAAAIYRAFHARIADLRTNNMCLCDGCTQAGNLKIKLVGHVGDVAVQKVKQMTELAGIDVILVHRLLKNDVPVPEYLLMTRAMYEHLDASMRDRASPLEVELDDLGTTPTFYVNLAQYVDEVPAAARLPLMARITRHLKQNLRAIPYIVGLKKACAGFRNVTDAAIG